MLKQDEQEFFEGIKDLPREYLLEVGALMNALIDIHAGRVDTDSAAILHMALDTMNGPQGVPAIRLWLVNHGYLKGENDGQIDN